jgi:hypothetical protein
VQNLICAILRFRIKQAQTYLAARERQCKN